MMTRPGWISCQYCERTTSGLQEKPGVPPPVNGSGEERVEMDKEEEEEEEEGGSGRQARTLETDLKQEHDECTARSFNQRSKQGLSV